MNPIIGQKIEYNKGELVEVLEFQHPYVLVKFESGTKICTNYYKTYESEKRFKNN